MSSASLSASELDRWNAWKRAHEAVLDDVEREIEDASGLSSPDFSVLTRLVELGGGVLRQQELADLLGWKRARLSRQISRLEQRGLLERETVSRVNRIRVTRDGRSAVRRARPAHARAVRRSLLARLPDQDQNSFWRAVGSLGPTSP